MRWHDESSGRWRWILRQGKAEVMGAVNALEAFPFLPCQGAEEAMRRDGARSRCPEMSDRGLKGLGRLRFGDGGGRQEFRRRWQSFRELPGAKDLLLAVFGKPLRGVDGGRLGQVDHSSHHGCQMLAYLRKRPRADRAMALEQAIDLGHDLIKRVEMDRPTSCSHCVPLRLDRPRLPTRTTSIVSTGRGRKLQSFRSDEYGTSTKVSRSPAGQNRTESDEKNEGSGWHA